MNTKRCWKCGYPMDQLCGNCSTESSLFAALKAERDSLAQQRAQLIAIAGNPNWILAPDGMTAEQHLAAGGQFADSKGAIHASMHEDTEGEMWMLVVPNPLAERVRVLEGALKAVQMHIEGETAYSKGCRLRIREALAAQSAKEGAESESKPDVCVVRPVDRSVLGQEQADLVPLPIADDRNENPDFAAWKDV